MYLSILSLLKTVTMPRAHFLKVTCSSIPWIFNVINFPFAKIVLQIVSVQFLSELHFANLTEYNKKTSFMDVVHQKGFVHRICRQARTPWPRQKECRGMSYLQQDVYSMLHWHFWIWTRSDLVLFAVRSSNGKSSAALGLMSAVTPMTLIDLLWSQSQWLLQVFKYI